MQVNKVLLGDNLPLLKNLPDESVDLVYADPPFNTGDSWSGDSGGYMDIYKEYVPAPAGLEWMDLVFDAGSVPYCNYMAHRLVEIFRVLKPSGHFFLHCDWRESAHLQVVVNWIFGKGRFKNEIIWCYPKSPVVNPYADKISCFSVAHNSILWWEKSTLAPFNPQYNAYTPKQIRKFFHHRDSTGRRFRTRSGRGPSLGKQRFYADEMPGIPLTDVWSLPIASPSERVGYPTQKPMALLNRIIASGSREGDLVVDPFCGAGTTLISARNLKRRYLGMDINEEAVLLAKRRLGFGGCDV